MPQILLLLFLILIPQPSLADEWEGEEEEETEDGEETTEEEAPGELDTRALEAAVEVPNLSRSQHSWLQPSRTQLPQKPRAQTDFTAYTLEWGETKLGLASITVGILPRTQLGTVPLLNVLGLANAHAKVNAVWAGGWDLALGGNYYRIRAGDFVGSLAGINMLNSVQLAAPWSLHLGVGYNMLSGDGVPDLSQLPSILRSEDDGEFASSQEGNEAQWYFQARALSMKMATDVRFNRRDSIILQGSAMLWADLTTGAQIPPILGLDQALASAEEGVNPIADTYVASISWQFAFRRTDLRLGLGVSNVPGAWLLPSTDFSYRFGGKTRREERRMNKTWKRNKADTKNAP